MHALLLCNGETPSRTLSRRAAAKADLVVAADGGANIALRCGITPHVIIGDLDSISPSTRRRFSSARVIQVSRQDNTDLEKALDYLALRKAKQVTILGATGKRIDFTLGNLAVIWNYTADFSIIVLADQWRAFPVTTDLTLKARKGTTVSIIPFGLCSGVTLKGLKYPLHDATMHVGSIGVSNVVVKSHFSVHVTRGNVLVIVFDKKL